MAFRIEVTGEAGRDLDEILDWLTSQHAADTVLRWFQRLERDIDSLASMPERCPIAP